MGHLRVAAGGGVTGDIMSLDKIIPFLLCVSRRRPAASEIPGGPGSPKSQALSASRVKCVSNIPLEDHPAFGLGANASPATIRGNCWPIGADAPKPPGMRLDDNAVPLAAGPDLQAILAASALDGVSPKVLATNLDRIDRVFTHYQAVAAGIAQFEDTTFTTTVMRPLMTWLQALSVLDEKTYGRCGQCATDLMSSVVSAEFGGHFTVRQLGTTDDLSGNLDGRATAAYFLEEIMPLLSEFYGVVESRGAGSRALESAIARLKGVPLGQVSPDASARGAQNTLQDRVNWPLLQTSQSLCDLRAVSSVPCPESHHSPFHDVPRAAHEGVSAWKAQGTSWPRQAS
jgi:hypothetical protein